MSTQDTLREKIVSIVTRDGKSVRIPELLEDEVDKLQALINSEVQAVLAKAHRANNTHDYDNETDVYIDEMLEELEKS